MLVIASYFAHREQLPPTRQKSWYRPINSANMNDSPMIEVAAKSPRIEETVAQQQRTAPSSLIRTASPVQTGSAAMYGCSLRSEQGHVEDIHA